MDNTKAFFFWAGFSFTLLVGMIIKLLYVSVDKYDWVLIAGAGYSIAVTLIMASSALKENKNIK